MKRVAESPCTNCGKLMDAASELGGDSRPSPGDTAICFYCHHLMMYADDLTLRDLTDAEMVDVAGAPEIIDAMKALAEFKKWEASERWKSSGVKK